MRRGLFLPLLAFLVPLLLLVVAPLLPITGAAAAASTDEQDQGLGEEEQREYREIDFDVSGGDVVLEFDDNFPQTGEWGNEDDEFAGLADVVVIEEGQGDEHEQAEGEGDEIADEDALGEEPESRERKRKKGLSGALVAARSLLVYFGVPEEYTWRASFPALFLSLFLQRAPSNSPRLPQPLGAPTDVAGALICFSLTLRFTGRTRTHTKKLRSHWKTRLKRVFRGGELERRHLPLSLYSLRVRASFRTTDCATHSRPPLQTKD